MQAKSEDLTEILRRLSLTFFAQHHEAMGQEAAREQLGHGEYLRRLAEGEDAVRYERGAIIITPNTAYKQWPRVFNNDATLTPAILDRLLHHCKTVTIEGKSYRMKDKI